LDVEVGVDYLFLGDHFLFMNYVIHSSSPSSTGNTVEH